MPILLIAVQLVERRTIGVPGNGEGETGESRLPGQSRGVNENAPRDLQGVYVGRFC
jgi:hypothetical protein